MIEEAGPGGQALFIDRLENYPGMAAPIKGFDLAEGMRAQAEAFGARFLVTKGFSLTKHAKIFESTKG